jgi:predicted P-loop ATPase
MQVQPLTVAHDAPIAIATGSSAQSKGWINETILWSKFVDKLRIPVVTNETMAQYQSMPSASKAKAKDQGGYVGGLLQGTTRGKNDVIERQLIALDLDNAEEPSLLWEIFCFEFKCAAVLHSTHSSTKEQPRLRLLIPTSRPLQPAEYTKASKQLAIRIGLSQFDDSTYEPNRLMFWPSICKDAGPTYVFEYNDAPWLDVTSLLEEAGEEELRVMAARDNPAALPGTVGKFCQRYNIFEAIRRFLPEVYEAQGNNRYRLIGAMAGAGLVVYGEGNMCYSHHTSDVIRDNGNTNAFDLVRIHKFGLKDAGIKKTTPPHERPSYKAMIEWIEEENLCEIVHWIDGLKVDRKGNPKATIDNFKAIINNDEELAAKFYLDEFADKVMVYGDFPWVGLADRMSLSWSDTDESGIRSFIETKYEISDTSKTRDALALAALEKKIHPVREYIKETNWDRTPRLDTLLIDFLGAADTNYTRAVTRKALIGAVARVFNPGCKHDHVLVLVGPQGCRKSTTIGKLGGHWYSDSLYTMQGKEAYELIQGYWIVEISEMAAFKRSEIESIKQFISKQSDNYRPAYGHNTVTKPRQCALFGSTNDAEFLNDPTGNRRFWPVEVKAVPLEQYNKLTQEYINQVWAEAYEAFKNKEVWHLDEEMEKEAGAEQERFVAVDHRQGLIAEFLEELVPESWYDMTEDEKNQAVGFKQPMVKRYRTCAAEIWEACLGGRRDQFSQAKGKEISNLMKGIEGWKSVATVNMGFPYGRTRGYVRI